MNSQDKKKHNLLVKICRMYYWQNMTHQEIGERLKLSRLKVTRLLKEAVAKRIVQFKIQDPYLDILKLEDRFKETFGLKEIIITSSPPHENEIFDVLGQHTAEFLQHNLRENMVIGMGWGRTLNGMIPYLQPANSKNLHVISLTGGLAANRNQPNPYDVVSAVAEKINATPHYLLIPAILESETAKMLLLQEQASQKIMEWWEKIDLAILSIGLLSPKAGVFYSFPDPQKEVEKAFSQGAVGDLLATPFNIHGKFLAGQHTRRMVVIDFKDLQQVPLVIGVAGGSMKKKSILGALRTGILNMVVIDKQTAVEVIKLHRA